MTRLLGKGAQARVYLAYDTRQGEWRAIKILAANFLDDKEVRARFRQEAGAMARLAHANVLRVMDIGMDGDTPFIVMALARGGGVTEWMRRNGPMPPKLACKLVIEACSGIAHAHGEGVVHRDIKPHNLLISEDGHALVTDFGIAQVAEGMSMTQTGSVMGTFAYMSPEQRNDAKSVDGRADVYSLGATLYTLLSLKTSAELFFAEARDEILAPIPELLRQPILDACRYDRDERMASVSVLSTVLRAIVPQLEDVPSPPLTDGVLPLPEGPPEWLEPGAGVDELQQALAVAHDDAPTYVPSSRVDVERLLAEQMPVMDSDTGYEDAPTIMPYAMPKRESTGHRARSTLQELSEEDIPEYIDLSTVTRSPSEPRRERVEIDSDGLKRIPVPPKPVGRGWLFYTAATVVICASIVVGVLGFGVFGKALASWSVGTTGAGLIEKTELHRGVITELSTAGANRERLEAAYFAFQDAAGPGAVEAAAAFVDLASSEAEQVTINEMGLSQLTQLVSAREGWSAAKESLAAAKASRLGQLTGELGVLR